VKLFSAKTLLPWLNGGVTQRKSRRQKECDSNLFVLARCGYFALKKTEKDCDANFIVLDMWFFSAKQFSLSRLFSTK